MTKTTTAPELHAIEHITPPNTLRTRLMAGSPSVPNPLVCAGHAVTALNRDCAAWVDMEIDRLHARSTAFLESPGDKDSLRGLCHAAMDLKGLAALGDNAAADRFVTNLITLLRSIGPRAALYSDLIEAHVDAIRATRKTTHDEIVAEILAEELEAQTQAALSGTLEPSRPDA